MKYKIKKWLEMIGISILIGTFLGLFVGNLMILLGKLDLLTTLGNKIDIYEIHRDEYIQ